ncbi:rCG30781 [Rattus norvegicus]|uniref:RCG30781 n=1 Tax=Rattus norvegicus TaxID=10116 RepID=A6IT97_RAT|nr:rCG30781 [Rattus norvegicus]
MASVFFASNTRPAIQSVLGVCKDRG